MSKSEAVVIESIEVRELLRFLFYLDILNKLSLLQRKHSKYMYAKCLNFPCFITYLAACMHAFCMFYLYVSLGILCFIFVCLQSHQILVLQKNAQYTIIYKMEAHFQDVREKKKKEGKRKREKKTIGE